MNKNDFKAVWYSDDRILHIFCCDNSFVGEVQEVNMTLGYYPHYRRFDFLEYTCCLKLGKEIELIFFPVLKFEDGRNICHTADKTKIPITIELARPIGN